MFLRAPFQSWCLTIAFCLATIFGVVGTASAISVFIDEFTVVRNGSPFFSDPFADGSPPPSAPNFVGGSPANYFVEGTMNETGGKVRLDTVGAAIGPGVAVNIPFFVERALLLTSIDASATPGLKSGDTFSVMGRFDVAVPTLSFAFYGIRLHEGTTANPLPNDLLQLAVRKNPTTGEVLVHFFRLDVQAGTFTSIAATPLDPSHEQIDLFLRRDSAVSNEISAAFAYVDSGISGQLTTFGPTTSIFNGESFTRAEFVSVEPTPEPATLLLFGATAAGLGLARWKQRRRQQQP
jgi:hypothetical protein